VTAATRLVFEIGTGDLTPGTEAFVRNAEMVFEKQHRPPPDVILFELKHETNPEATLPLLQAMSGKPIASRPGNK
jgi:hypothetical protein